MRIGILGPVELHDARGQLRIGGPKDRLLLVRLALSARRMVTADALIEGLWAHGERPEDPANALQVKVSRLRKVIGPARLETRSPGYVLQVDDADVDAIAFRQLAEAGRAARRQGAQEEALAAFNRALALWRGPALRDVSDDYVVETERMRLEEERVDVIEERIETELAMGRHGAVLSDLQARVREHPLRERLWAQLMTALYREGRQADALQAFADVRGTLVEQLGVEPGPELTELQRRILAHDPDLFRPADAQPAIRPVPGEPSRGNVREPRTSFVGRDTELAMVASQLERVRLLTLTGPGGVGKSRIAVETGRRLPDRFPNGVWITDLTDARDFEGVVNAMAAAAGVRDVDDPLLAVGTTVGLIERLTARFSRGDTLLILDHCEHVLPAAADAVEAFLGSCPSIRVLAASREPLRVEGEFELRVAPLSAPDAVALFVDRARALRPSFSLLGDDGSIVTGICRRLDNIPLAVELAAARVKVLPLDQIASRLEDRFGLLVSGTRRPRRQQALRATVDWSYDLLTAEERVAFEQLSVFKGGGSYEAVEELCAVDGLDRSDVLDVISRLVDKSMLIADVRSNEPARYSMLETLRQYGLEKLAESGRLDDVRARHARIFLRRAEAAEPSLRGPEQAPWLTAVQLDEENYLAALDWAIATGAVELGLRLGIALGWYWYLAGRQREARRRLAALLRHSEAPPALRARALGVAGLLAEGVHDLADALTLTEEALTLATGAGHDFVLAMVTAQRGQVLGRVGRTQPAFDALHSAISAFVALDARWEIGASKLALGYNHLREGDLEAAEREIAAAHERFDVVGDRWSSIRSLIGLASVAEAARGPDAARSYMVKAVSVARNAGLDDVAHQLNELLAGADATEHDDGGDEPGASWALTPDARPVACNRLGIQARQRGELDLARTFHGEALAWYQRIEWLGGTAVARAGLAGVACAEGDADASHALYEQALGDAVASGDGHALAVVLEGVAAVAARLSDGARAGLLLGAANAIRDRDALPRAPADQHDVDRIRERVEGPVFAEAMRRGEGSSRAVAVGGAHAVLAAAAARAAAPARS